VRTRPSEGLRTIERAEGTHGYLVADKDIGIMPAWHHY
jgi:hypothetical protein